MNKKPLILIVDDNPENIQVLGNIIAANRCEMVIAVNGYAALDFIQTSKPDLILLDILMPDMDGFQLCEIIKKNENLKDIPIIFITALADIHNKIKAFELGAVDYITKPFHHEEVIARVNTHLKIQRQKDELQELGAVKDRFFSLISHDLKNPLITIGGINAILVEELDKIDESLHQPVNILYDATKKLINLTENLLDWSKIQRNKFSLSPEELNLRQITRSGIDILSLQAKKKNVSIVMDIPPEIVVRSDKNILQLILRNIVSNSIKFSKADSEVLISAAAKGDRIEISIKDHGIGISEKNLNKLFRLDSRVNTRGTAGEEGTGLGLILCREFLDKINGSIKINSVLGEGTSIIVSLYKELILED